MSDGGSCEVSGSDSDRVVNNPAPLQQFALCHHIEKSPQALGLNKNIMCIESNPFENYFEPCY